MMSHLPHTKQRRKPPHFWHLPNTLSQNEKKSLKLIDQNVQKVLLVIQRK